MNRRRHLGSVYTSYPAREWMEYMGDKVYKIIATVVCCALWTVCYRVLIGVVNFNRQNFLQGAKPMDSGEMFKSEASLWVLAGSYLVILFLVFRSRIGEKGKTKDKGKRA